MGGYAALRSSAWLTTATLPRDGATSHATTRTAKDTNARISISASLNLVRGFAVLRGVEAEDFLVLWDAQSDEDIDELQDHERHDRRVDDRGGHRDRLDAELSGGSVQEPVIHGSAAIAAAVFVTTNAFAARPPAVIALPALKPNQPNQSSEAPRTVIVASCGSSASRP